MVTLNLRFNHPEYPDDRLNASISDILNNNILLAMATVKDGESYINTAYYCFNSRLHFYILTEPSTQHSQNVVKNRSAALAIYDSRQPWDGDKRGLQIFGECELATGTEVEEATHLYLERFPGLSKWIRTADDFHKGIINSKMYSIRTRWLKILDEVNFGKENFITLTVPA